MPRVERPAMSDYGVPTHLDGALPWEWAHERLVANRNFWVGTVSTSGQPSSTPVWGVWMPTDRFWFSCSPNSRKARNLAANHRCVITVDDTVECVSLEGQARLVNALDPTLRAGANPRGVDEQLDAAVVAYVNKYWPDTAAHAEAEQFIRSHVIFEVTPVRAFGIIERDDEFATRATRWAW